ncbi:hypothetical protein PTKIN_Ptkin05aG0022900 [Pterospermum kingtungense]
MMDYTSAAYNSTGSGAYPSAATGDPAASSASAEGAHAASGGDLNSAGQEGQISALSGGSTDENATAAGNTAAGYNSSLNGNVVNEAGNAAKMADFIPQEIILQILHRLPIKTLVKCTLVCKSWQSLITGSDFINSHLAKTLCKPITSQPLLTRHFTESPNKEHYILHLNRESLDIYQTLKSPLKPRTDDAYPRIVGTLHGLICLSDDLFGYTNRIVLWNPSVRRYVELPTPNITFREIGPYYFTLGFGLDAKKNDYKVVRLAYAEGSNYSDVYPPYVEVFSVEEKGWRMISGEGLECSFSERWWSQFFLNGRVYWIAYEKKMGRDAENLVLSFDMEDEKFEKMMLPESLVDVNPTGLFISLTKGMLRVYEYYVGEANNRCVNVWVRTEYGDLKSWSKLYSIDLLGGRQRVLGLTEKDEVFVAKPEGRMRDSYADLLLYDPKSGQTKLVQPHGIIDTFSVADYTASLVFLNKESGATSYDGAKIERKQK